jgi:hypothetical protein
MYVESTVPAIPEIVAKIKYKVPISLWFVEKSHRLAKLNNSLFDDVAIILNKLTTRFLTSKLLKNLKLV